MKQLLGMAREKKEKEVPKSFFNPAKNKPVYEE